MEEEYVATYDNQTAALMELLEGERARTIDKNFLGEFELTGIPPAPRGVPEVAVSFEIDVNGILNVSAEDRTSGSKNNMTIINDKGRLSAEEIQRMLQEAEFFKAEDEQHRRISEAKNALERIMCRKKNGMNFGFKLTYSDKKKVELAIEMDTDWLENNEPNHSHSFSFY